MNTVDRRTLLGGAAGLGAAGVVGAGAVIDPVAADVSQNGPRHAQSSGQAGPSTVASALPALRRGEEAQMYFAADLFASSGSAGASLVYNASMTGCYVSPGGWLGTTPILPVGSVLTGVDATLNGSPRTSSVFVDYHEPAGAGFIGTLGSAYFTSGTGVETQSIALNKLYTGAEVFEVYFGGLSSTSVARGVRVRYIPPASPHFVPQAARGLYDSKSASIGTRPKAVAVASKAGVPDEAKAVVLNVKVSHSSKRGAVQVTPYGKKSSTFDQQYLKGQTISHLCIVPLRSGKVQVRVSDGKARIALMVSGYFLG